MDLHEWDIQQLQQVAGVSEDETLNVERKASDKFSFTTRGRVTDDTRNEIAKQVCAFSNAEGGFLVFGLSNDGMLDQGVPSRVGGQTIKEWVEQTIPNLVKPQVTTCQAKFIDYPNEPDRGALIIQIPQSEGRPHWYTDSTGRDHAYLRVGAHSSPMSLQTFRDILSRGPAPRVVIDDLSDWYRWRAPQQPTLLDFRPAIRLIGGPLCRMWAVDIFLDPSVGNIEFFPNANTKKDQGVIHVAGQEPLYPQRRTFVPGTNLRLVAPAHMIATDRFLTVSLYAESADPTVRRFSLKDVYPP